MDWALVAPVAVALCTALLACAFKLPDLYGHLQKTIWIVWSLSVFMNIGFLIGIEAEHSAAVNTFKFLTRSGNPVYANINDFDPSTYPEIIYGWLTLNFVICAVLGMAYKINRFSMDSREIPE